MYKHLSKAWKRPGASYVKEVIRKRAIKWRKEPAVVRVEKPTRIDSARRVGYKAKQGFVVVRARIRKGGRKKPRPRMGRRPKKMGIKKYTPAKSLRKMAEERVARKYPNLKVLGSYWVWDDGKQKWFEIILVDTQHPTIKGDEEIRRQLPAKL